MNDEQSAIFLCSIFVSAHFLECRCNVVDAPLLQNELHWIIVQINNDASAQYLWWYYDDIWFLNWRNEWRLQLPVIVKFIVVSQSGTSTYKLCRSLAPKILFEWCWTVPDTKVIISSSLNKNGRGAKLWQVIWSDPDSPETHQDISSSFKGATPHYPRKLHMEYHGTFPSFVHANHKLLFRCLAVSSAFRLSAPQTSLLF